MKIVHLSTTLITANTRLHNALLKKNIDSKLIVLGAKKDIPSLIVLNKNIFVKLQYRVNNYLEKIILHFFYPNREKLIFSIARFGINHRLNNLLKDADIIHLHWINMGFISMNVLKKIINTGKPIVWTAHDSWPFTGGCHVRYNCQRFVENCGKCPILNSKHNNDITSMLLSKKQKIFNNANITMVAPSSWMLDNIKKSKLFENSDSLRIINPLNIDLFRPIDKIVVRKKLHLDLNKKMLLFGAVNATNTPYKGYNHIIEALEILIKLNPEIKNNMQLCVFGSNKTETSISLPLETKFFGVINDESELVDLYNSADLFIAPSLEECLGYTIMESLACGTPVVAFNTGGIPDMVKNKENGYLAKHSDSEDLANGILWVCNNNINNILGNNARRGIESIVNDDVVANQYIDLYKSLL